MSDTKTEWGVAHSQGIHDGNGRLTEQMARESAAEMHARWKKYHRMGELEPHLVSRQVTEWTKAK